MATPINPTTEKLLRGLKARWVTIKSGLLRDRFALAAMQGLLSSGKYEVDDSRIARLAYAQADAMLAARRPDTAG